MPHPAATATSGSHPHDPGFGAWLERLPTGAAVAALTVLGLAFRVALLPGYRPAGLDRAACAYLDVAHHIASGAGFATNIYKYLFVPPAYLPQPDAHWSPLLPLLTAAAFRLGGESSLTAHVVPLLFGIAVPPLVYALGLVLAGSRRIA